MKARTIRGRPLRPGLSDPRSPRRAATARSLLPAVAAATVVVLAFELASARAGAAAGLGVGGGLALAGCAGVMLRRRRRAAQPAESLHGALALLARALEPAREAFLVLGPDARVRVANAAAADLVGRELRDLAGCPAHELIGCDIARGAELRESLAAGRPWRIRFSPSPLRAGLQVEASFVPLHDRRGALEGGVAFLRDVTHEARLEAGAHRSLTLQTLGRLAAGVIHDFNNFLLVIEGYAAQALSHAGADPEPRQALLQIRRAARRAAELSAQVLAFGRRQPERPRVVRFDAAVRDALPLVRQMLPENVAIELETGAKGRRVRVDPGQIERVLLNLAVNARDAMPGGGRLSLRTSGVTCADPSGPAGWVLLEVTDTGIGMDEATCEQIFEPFFSSKEDGGTGLGLGNVFGIVEQCGGRVEVHTCLGEGTRFRIRFPATEDPLEPGEPPVPPAPTPPAGGARVLLVEDDEAVRELIERQLRRAGFAVSVAADAGQALARSAGEPFDVLVTDVSLPGLDGPGLARRLQERWPGLCVLFTSGYAADERMAHATSDPLTELLAKPFDEEQLWARIHALLERRSEAPTD